MLLIVLATGAALVAYPLLPYPGRRALYVAISWAVLIPVALALRRCPAPLRTPWRLLLAAIAIGAVGNTLQPSPELEPQWAPAKVVVAAVPLAASLLLLLAAAGVAHQRGRDDLGGLIDASLATLALGGLLWSIVILPRLQSPGASERTSLAVLVLILAATLGAMLRLVETDATGNCALRLLLAAVAFNLAGFVIIGGWAKQPVGALGVMMFIAAFGMLAVASLDPSMPSLAAAGSPRPDRLGVGRLIFLAVALLSVPVVVGARNIQGHMVDGAFLIAAAALIVGLVMLRIGLLGRQLHRSQEALQHMATHDPLTDTLNRRAFTETLAGQLKTPRECALIFCDLDGFKEVNDSYGHAAGDRLLIDVARRLRSSVRQQDVVCRLGGDEFVILLSGAGRSEAEAVRRRITGALKEPFPDIAANVAITASIGAIVSDAGHRGAVTAEELIEQADAAMYADKGSTRVRPDPDRL